MGALLQLMALPAACMLFAWARHSGVSAVTLALCRLVATAAVRAAPRARIVPRVALRAAATKTPKAGKAVRSRTVAGTPRRGEPDDPLACGSISPRAVGIDDSSSRMRRVPPRWVIAPIAT